MKAKFYVRNFNPWGHKYSKGTVTVLTVVNLNGAHLFNRQHRITYPTTIWLSCHERIFNEKTTKNNCKKKRSKICLELVDKVNLKKQINFCLDNVFSHNKNIETASLYLPIKNEISPFIFKSIFEKKNLIISMPVIDIKNKSLNFKKWNQNDKLIKGPMGNLEPLKNKKSIMPQILIVPMLSFDRDLFRLGYGGGYYDKTIYLLKNYFKKEKKFFITIGLAYSSQEIKNIPKETHDMSLDYIITEKEVLSKLH